MSESSLQFFHTCQPVRGVRNCNNCDCSLCGEFQETSAPLHHRLVPEAPQSRVLEESQDWIIIPTVGPLTPGHVMLVPRRHYYSLSDSPSNILSECIDLLEGSALKLNRLYEREVVVFEHGMTPGGPRDGGGCIEHAHLHIIPGPPSFIFKVLAQFDDWLSGPSLVELLSRVGPVPYILVGQVQPVPFFYARQCWDLLPSQFLRLQFAEALGGEVEWDWRKDANAAVFLKTISDWKGNIEIPEACPR